MDNKKTDTQEKVKYTLSLPDELLTDIKKEADRKGLSVNELILLTISKRLGSY